MLFYFLYILSFYLVLSSDDWFMVWMGLELNMLSFMLLVYKQMVIKNIESCLKYFFIQSLGSVLFLVLLYLNEFLFNYMVTMIMGYKMGAGMFFFWFPPVCSGLGWWSIYFLMSFQKIIPLMVSSFFISWVIWMLLLLSLVIGSFGSLNQKNMKNLMAFSSIHHLGWMMMCIIIDDKIWFYYLVMYGFVILPVIYLVNCLSVNGLMEIGKWKDKMIFVVLFLNMGGMPPMLGFFMKWMVFYYMMKWGILMYMLMIFMSVLIFYVYVRIVSNFLMSKSVSLSWNYKKSFFKYFIMTELVSVCGIGMGICLSLYILMYKIKKMFY